MHLEYDMMSKPLDRRVLALRTTHSNNTDTQKRVVKGAQNIGECLLDVLIHHADYCPSSRDAFELVSGNASFVDGKENYARQCVQRW